VIAKRLGLSPKSVGDCTLGMLTKKVVEPKIARLVSHETSRRTLKKRMTNRVLFRKCQHGLVPDSPRLRVKL
jgi:hypothetical protein